MQRLINGLPLLVLIFGTIALADFWGRVSQPSPTLGPKPDANPTVQSVRSPQQLDKRTTSRKL